MLDKSWVKSAAFYRQFILNLHYYLTHEGEPKCFKHLCEGGDLLMLLAQAPT